MKSAYKICNSLLEEKYELFYQTVGAIS